MESKLRGTFDKIHADADLKERTAEYLRGEIGKRRRTAWMGRQRFAAACACLALLLFVGGFACFTPSAYVDMDVNPSIALSLNRFGFVLKASPYNDDGAAILENMDVRHKSCEQAVELLLTEMLRQGYVKEDGLVSVTIQTENNSAQEKMLGKIRASVDTLLDSHHSTASADVFAVSEEVRDCAHDHNLSPAKYLAITQLQEVDPSASYDRCAEHSISEIKELTKEHCGGHHEEGGGGNRSGEDTGTGEEHGARNENKTGEETAGDTKDGYENREEHHDHKEKKEHHE